jgi:hypothetical protein
MQDDALRPDPVFYAISCVFVRAIAHTALLQDSFFGGKENTGDGTPEGLPLIFRFSYLTPALREAPLWGPLDEEG